MRRRIVLIHALRASIDPSAAAFARAWPEAELVHLLDDALSRDVARAGGVDEAMVVRFRTLGRYARSIGGEGLLFTCSAFGSAIDDVRAELDVPVLKPNEAMLTAAVQAGGRVALVATFAPTLASMASEARAEAERQRSETTFDLVHAVGALEALEAGDVHAHDERIAAAAAEAVASGTGVVALAQFSMARAAAEVAQRCRVPVLTTPDAAVALLRQRVAARAS
jgi:aspartate/glutamate racemase